MPGWSCFSNTDRQFQIFISQCNKVFVFDMIRTQSEHQEISEIMLMIKMATQRLDMCKVCPSNREGQAHED